MDNEDYSGDESETDQEQFANFSSNVLVAVDCAASMFQPDPSSQIPFQTVIKSLDTICENMVLKKSSKNKIAICFFHPDEDKRCLLDFDTPFVNGMNKLKEIKDEFKSYSTDGLKCNFSSFLLECKKKFNKVPNEGKYMCFITNNADPTGGDVKIKSLAMRELGENGSSNIRFELLPLNDDFDYQPFFAEAFLSLNRPVPKYYYTEEFLVSTIQEAIKYKTANRYLKLYLGRNCNENVYITCAQRTFTSEGKINPNILITKEEPIKKVTVQEERNLDEEFNFELEKIEKKLSKLEKWRLNETPNVKIGLTIIKSSKKQFSKFYKIYTEPKVLKAKTNSNPNFVALWESCVKENLNLQCLLKYTEFGKVHIVELIPKTINQQRHFLMFTFPTTLFFPKRGVRKSKRKVIEHVDPCETIVKLIQFTTFDYEEDDMIAPDYLEMVDYFKRELFGAEYVPPARKDWVTDKMYVNDIGKHLEALESLYPEEKLGTKRVKDENKSKNVKKAKV